jgi:catechol 2,3-dioxygenase-like lactoylglutathione lyase family enzyme
MRQGAWAIDHVGFTVPDLAEAIDFFVDAFGCEVVLQCGPYENVGYVWPGETQAEPGSLRLAILRQGSHNVELLEYGDCSSCRLSEPPRPAEVGSGHIAFYVDDIDGAVDELRARPGVRILGEIITEENGPLKGLDWVYVLTPWGMLIELIRWPLGMPYEQTTKARLATPPVLQGIPPDG